MFCFWLVLCIYNQYQYTCPDLGSTGSSRELVFGGREAFAAVYYQLGSAHVRIIHLFFVFIQKKKEIEVFKSVEREPVSSPASAPLRISSSWAPRRRMKARKRPWAAEAA